MSNYSCCQYYLFARNLVPVSEDTTASEKIRGGFLVCKSTVRKKVVRNTFRVIQKITTGYCKQYRHFGTQNLSSDLTMDTLLSTKNVIGDVYFKSLKQ